MAHRLGELGEALGLTVEGDPEVDISGLASIEDAGPGELSFVAAPRYRKAFLRANAAAYILPPDFDAQDRAALRSLAPYADFARLVPLFFPRPPAAPGVHETAVVADGAQLGTDVSIGACAVIGEGARIGDRTHIHAHVTVYPGVVVGPDCELHSGVALRESVRLGARVVVQNGAVLGSEGFGFTFEADGRRVRIPHRCGVHVGDDVEIGANTTIDSSHPGQQRYGRSYVTTWIGNGVKIDNLVQVGHGVSIGDGSSLSAQVGLAGSTEIGRHVVFGGKSASAGHLRVGDGAIIGAMAAPAGDVEPGEQLLGVPAMERRLWGRVVVATKRLPELLKRVKRIEDRLELDDT